MPGTDVLVRALSGILESSVRKLKAGKLKDRDVIDSLTNGIFAQHGQRYFFLFKQNLRRTNIQVAELISLVLQHSSLIPTASISQIGPSRIDFTTFSNIKDHITGLIENASLDNELDRRRIISELSVFFSNKIILEIHYGSCSVFFPPHIQTDIRKICGESGYIHSCGNLLLLRNATKANHKDFRRAINEAKALLEPNSKFMLIPYSHEDFSKTDRNSTPFLKNGLDDVKVHLSKAFVGSETLATVLDREARHFRNDILLAPAGDYNDVPELFDDQFESAKRNTIWVLSESDFVPGSQFPGEKKFYMVYLQRYSSINILHNFEENKPGWASHTTLPHTLTGAMINVCRPWTIDTSHMTLLDPFGGSGTTLLEASKLVGVDAYASDLAPIYQYVTDTNLEFFGLDATKMKRLVRRLKRFAEAPVAPTRRLSRSSVLSEGQWVALALALAQQWAKSTNDDFLKLDAESLERGFSKIGQDLDKRILLYTALKALGRGRGEIERGGTQAVDAFRSELKEIIASADRMRKTLELPVEETALEPGSPLSIVSGAYSASVRTSIGKRPLLVDELAAHFHLHRVGDPVHANEGFRGQASYDVIVTDPPYGFNTKEDFWAIAQDVRSWLRELIGSLKPEGGQLIMACPDVSFSGRAVLPFMRAGFLSKEIVRLAAELKRECIRPALNLPQSVRSLGPPYYWVAEKTLRRKILHFWIRALPADNNFRMGTH